jgi:Arc/MetJ-type ribon-helix-helix transcriptional regulator
MIISMSRCDRITVSLPAELVAAARRAVRQGRASSMSAYVAGALEKVQAEDVFTMLDEMLEETGGPISAEERAWVDSVLKSGG